MFVISDRSTNEPMLLIGLNRQDVEGLLRGIPVEYKFPSSRVGVVFGETDRAIVDELVQEGVLKKEIDNQGGVDG